MFLFSFQLCIIGMDIKKISISYSYFHTPYLFFTQGAQGSAGPKGDKVCYVCFIFKFALKIKPSTCDSYDKTCVAGREGHRTGRSSWSGWASRFKGE